MAPILGRTNPAGVPVVEHVMQNLIDAPPPDNTGQEHKPASALPARSGSRTPDAEHRRRMRADYEGPAHENTPEARTHRCLMEMLVDMHRDLLAAS
jgi:hypothetical protein